MYSQISQHQGNLYITYRLTWMVSNMAPQQRRLQRSFPICVIGNQTLKFILWV